jgi:hypothetical protein
MILACMTPDEQTEFIKKIGSLNGIKIFSEISETARNISREQGKIQQ